MSEERPAEQPTPVNTDDNVYADAQFSALMRKVKIDRSAEATAWFSIPAPDRAERIEVETPGSTWKNILTDEVVEFCACHPEVTEELRNKWEPGYVTVQTPIREEAILSTDFIYNYYPCPQEELEDDDEEPVFVLWDGGGIEEFKNADDAREELMVMASRGYKGMEYGSQDEAESAQKAIALAFQRKQ